ncbi:MAG: CopG family ribbon-helix-helix protein [Rhodoplanes sp.]
MRVDSSVKRRLEKLAKSTGRSRSFLAAEAIDAYLDVNEWQVDGIIINAESHRSIVGKALRTKL